MNTLNNRSRHLSSALTINFHICDTYALANPPSPHVAPTPKVPYLVGLQNACERSIARQSLTITARLLAFPIRLVAGERIRRTRIKKRSC